MGNDAGGDYDMAIIVGDANVDQAIVWDIATITLSFADDPIPLPVPVSTPFCHFCLGDLLFQSSNKPELHHTFRGAEKRPAEIVSLVFTGLVVASFLFLLKMIGSLGITFSLPEGDPPHAASRHNCCPCP